MLASTGRIQDGLSSAACRCIKESIELNINFNNHEYDISDIRLYKRPRQCFVRHGTVGRERFVFRIQKLAVSRFSDGPSRFIGLYFGGAVVGR